MRVLPVSIRPAVVDRMVDSIQFHVSVNISETVLVSAHKYAIDPMHFVESVLPNVNSPFWFDRVCGFKLLRRRGQNSIVPWLVEVVCDCGNEVILTRSTKSQATRSNPKTDGVSADLKG